MQSKCKNNRISYPTLKTERERNTHTQIYKGSQKARTVNRMNSFFPNTWSIDTYIHVCACKYQFPIPMTFSECFVIKMNCIGLVSYISPKQVGYRLLHICWQIPVYNSNDNLRMFCYQTN